MEKYKVIKIMRKTGNRYTIEKNLTREQAQTIVKASSNHPKHMICFTKQNP